MTASPERRDTLHAEGRQIAALRSLYNSNFRFYFFNVLCSFGGYQMHLVARAYLATVLTDSPLLVTVVTGSFWLPTLLVSPLAGVLGDRVNRKALNIVEDVTAILLYICLTVLLVFDLIGIWSLFGFSIALGTAYGLGTPSRQALLMNVIKREEMTNGMALNAMVFNGAQIGGPALAGLLIGAFSIEVTFAIAIAVAALGVLSLLFVRAGRPAQMAREPALTTLMEGVKYVRARPVLLGLTISFLLAALFLWPFQSVLPLMARDVLSVGPQKMGFLYTAAGVGALLGSSTLAFLGDRKGLAPAMLVTAVTAGLAMILLGLFESYAIALAVLCFLGFSVQLSQTIGYTFTQGLVADRLRARVLAVRMTMLGVRPVGEVTMGGIAQAVNVPAAFWVAGMAYLALLVVLYVWVRSLLWVMLPKEAPTD